MKPSKSGHLMLTFLLASMGWGAAAIGCAESEDVRTHELLQSVLWMQTAAERRALSLQIYEIARTRLEQALADPSWTAAVEQTAGYTELPPAVILDVDETVLDNSPFEARLIVNQGVFESETWTAWCREARALPIPGAVEFTRHAAANGVTVFYVTNRDHIVEEPTRANLAQHGFPLESERDTLFTRGETEAWATSDKTPRRREVAVRYRVLLLVGDDLNDFVAGTRRSRPERDAIVDEYASYWGTRWIVLPNPEYGGWDGALIDFDYDRSEAERRRAKIEALRLQ